MLETFEVEYLRRNLRIRVSYTLNYKTAISDKITCWCEQFPLKSYSLQVESSPNRRSLLTLTSYCWHVRPPCGCPQCGCPPCGCPPRVGVLPVWVSSPCECPPCGCPPCGWWPTSCGCPVVLAQQSKLTRAADTSSASKPSLSVFLFSFIPRIYVSRLSQRGFWIPSG